MIDPSVEVDKIAWDRLFPWLRLFRVLRTAADLRMLLLACVGLIALGAADALFFHLPFAPDASQARQLERRDDLFPSPPEVPAWLHDHWMPVGMAGYAVLSPARSVWSPATTILQRGVSWSQKVFAWTRLLWALCIWGVVGGAMTRIAAVEQARDTRISLVAAIRFSLQNFVSYLIATLLPAAGIGIFWILCLIGGWIGLIPFVGPPVLGLLWGAELLFGFAMAMIAIGTAAGWPLMYATISAEGSDGFDGFSRAFSYVYSRAWQYVWYAGVALVYGTLMTLFAWGVASLVAYLSAAGVSSGLGTVRTGAMLLGAPKSLPILEGIIQGADARIGIGSVLASVWLEVLALLLAGFATSYFWTSSTVIYLLLRQVDDATDPQEIYLPDEKETDELLPLVGVAASKQPIIERPPQGDFVREPRNEPSGTSAEVANSPPGTADIPQTSAPISRNS